MNIVLVQRLRLTEKPVGCSRRRSNSVLFPLRGATSSSSSRLKRVCNIRALRPVSRSRRLLLEALHSRLSRILSAANATSRQSMKIAVLCSMYCPPSGSQLISRSRTYKWASIDATCQFACVRSNVENISCNFGDASQPPRVKFPQRPPVILNLRVIPACHRHKVSEKRRDWPASVARLSDWAAPLF
jgi:hypothetical protein